MARSIEKAADYRVETDNGAELGAGWKKTSRDGKAYMSVKLDSPFSLKPINAALFEGRNGGEWQLVWQRQTETVEAAA